MSIWNDKGSGANKGVSIWRPIDYQAGYYPLGDVAVASHDKPSSVAMTVSAVESNALKAPKDFTEIWNDKKSRANKNVKIYKMNPYDGYTCLGHVAISGSYSTSTKPDVNEYR